MGVCIYWLFENSLFGNRLDCPLILMSGLSINAIHGYSVDLYFDLHITLGVIIPLCVRNPPPSLLLDFTQPPSWELNWV